MIVRQGPVPHSVRTVDGPIESWPPPGWTPEGLDRHRDQWVRTRAMLLACSPDPTQVAAFAARRLRDTADAVLAAATTEPIPVQEAV